MHFLKILVMTVLTVFLFVPAAKAELHSDTVIGNGETFVDIDRTITRGGIIYPIFYTSRRDLYGYPIHTICELKEIYYDDIIKLYENLYSVKATVYDDLRIVIYESEFPYDIKQVYREVKDLQVHEYCEVSFVTNHPDMGLTYVTPIEGETSPAGNPMTWWTKFDRMLTTFPSSFTPKK